MMNISLSSFSDEFLKIAVDAVTDPASVRSEGETAPAHREHPALTALKGIGGYALGAGVGYTGAHYLNKGIQAVGGDGLPLSVLRYGGPLIGGAAGLGFGLLQHRMTDRMKNYWSPTAEAPTNGLDENIRR